MSPIMRISAWWIWPHITPSTPRGAAAPAIELIAVDAQKALSRSCLVDRFFHDLDAGDAASDIVAQEFVVIAGHVDHARAVIDFLQDLAHPAILGFAPVPALHLPAVNDVADEIERVAGIVLQEVGEHLGLAA